MKELENCGFSTQAIHAGAEKNPFGVLATPIYQTSTFVFDTCEQGGRRFAGEEEGYIYTRLGNPTTSALERKVAALEHGEDAVAASSGMGAITSAIWSVCKAGDHIIADEILYGCTYAYLSRGITRYGVDVSFIDTSDTAALKAAIRPNTTLVYLETPANPTLKVEDIAEIAQVAHSANHPITLMVDNTFASPYNQLPIELGADVVVHSVTKYLNGHGDVIGGLVVGKKSFITEVRLFGLKDMTGAVMGPFEAYLVLRGLKTLDVRMARHNENAMKIAEWLERHPKVEEVYYPGLHSFPGHEIAKKQMQRGFGGMLAFEVKGGRAAGAKLLNSCKLCTIAVSLGDAETLLEHPASMTHSPYSAEELKEAGISEGLVRMSAGLENVEDIIADLAQAFEAI
ncbi:MAG: methionine gamma-lyase [Oscillospiraceae bacterium]